MDEQLQQQTQLVKSRFHKKFGRYVLFIPLVVFILTIVIFFITQLFINNNVDDINTISDTFKIIAFILRFVGVLSVLALIWGFILWLFFRTKQSVAEGIAYDERSGKGTASILPEELKGWSWGAAGLSWIWGLYHRVWISLLIFIPVINLFWWIVLGINGNKWAWSKEKWLSVDHFKKAQKKWKIWGIIIIIIYIISLLINILFFSLNFIKGGDDEIINDEDILIHDITFNDGSNSFHDLISLPESTLPPDLDLTIDNIGSLPIETMIEIVDNNKEILAIWTGAASRINFQNPQFALIDEYTLDATVVPLDKWRKAARISAVNAHLQLKLKNDTAAFEEALKMIKISSDIQKSQSTTITYLVALSITGMGLNTFEHILTETELSPEIQNIYKLELEKHTFTKTNSYLKGEYLFFKNSLDEIVKEYIDEVPHTSPFTSKNYLFKPNQTINYKAEITRTQLEYFLAPCDTPLPETISEEKRIKNETWLKLLLTENVIGKIVSSVGTTALNNIKIKMCEQEEKYHKVLNQFPTVDNLDLQKDTDSDGLSDIDEITIYKTNPNDSDTDNDGFSDGDEVKNGFSPLN